MRDRDLPQELARADNRDAAPVGEHGHRELSGPLERLLIIERGGELAAGIAEQSLGELGALAFGDVLDRVDHKRQLPVRLKDRHRLVKQPADASRAPPDAAHDDRRRPLTLQRSRRGEVLETEAAALLVVGVEQIHQLVRAGREELLDRADAKHLRRRAVGEHHASAHVADDDAGRKVGERRLELAF